MQLFRSPTYTLRVILFLALILRFVALLCMDIHPVSDAGAYVRLAENLMNGNGFTDNGSITAYRLPGYPVFLAAVFSISHSIPLVQIVQILIDVCSCFFLFRIGSLLFSAKSGLVAALIWAVLPSAIVHTSFMLTETLFTSLFLGSLTLLFYKKNQAEFSFGRGRLFAIGVLWGVCSLIKPNIMLAPISIFLLCFVKERKITAKVFGYIGVVIAGMTIVLAPWVTRNYMSFGKATLSTNGGVNFWIGNNPLATGTYNYPSDNPIESVSGEVTQSELGYQLGWEFVKSHPLKTIVLAGKKTAYMFVLDSPVAIALSHGGATSAEGSTYRDLYKQTQWWLLALINLPYCLLIIAGIVGFSRSYYSSALLLLFIGFWLFTHAVYFGGARFHFPILPLFALGAASLPIPVLSQKRRLIVPGILSALLLVLWGAEIFTVFFH